MGKILYVATPPYDLNPFMYNVQGIGLGKAFCRLGFDFDCIRFKKADQNEWTFYEKDGCKLVYTEKGRLRLFRWGICPELCNEAFLSQYDYIIVREYYQIMSYLLSKGRSNVFIYSGHYNDPFMFPFTSPIYDAIFTKRLNRQTGAVFVKSPLAKEFLVRKGYENVIDVGVGLDTERFETEIDMDARTAELARFMDDHECLLFVGSLSEVKNYPFLLDVFEELKERKPELLLVVIGKSKQSATKKLLGKSDDSYAKEVEAKLPKSVTESIVHIEEIENAQLRFVYPRAKALLLPSKSEIFGMVMLEAMYLGAPVITSVHGGSMSISPDDKAGIVLPGFNKGDWVDAALGCLENPELARARAAEARRRVCKDFTWDAIARKMLDEMIIRTNGKE